MHFKTNLKSMKGKYVRGMTLGKKGNANENPVFFSPLSEENSGFLKRYLPIILIIIVTAFVYSFSLGNEATNWDDDKYIGDNPLLKTFDKETVSKMFFSDDPNEKYFMGNYHPLTMLSLNMNYQIAEIGANGRALPYTFIFINIILHLMSVFLVYLVFSQLFNKHLYPIVIALLFGIHTLHVESVTWIAERKDVLYTMFYFLSLLCYILYKKRQKVMFYILSLIIFIISALSKGQAVSLTITLFLVDYFLLDDSLFNQEKFFMKKDFWKLWIDKIPFFIISIVFGLISVKAQAASTALAETDQYEAYQRIAFGSNGFLQYILRFILPIKLSCLYPYPDILNRTVPVLFWLTVPIFISVILLVFFMYKKNKIFTFGLAFFIVNIALLLQFIPVGSAMYADRYSYIPSVGLSILIAYILDLLMDKYKKYTPILYSVFGVYCLLLCIMTVNREKVWQNSRTLWSDCVEKYPEAVIGWNNLGSYINMMADSTLKNKDDREYLKNKKLAIDCFTSGIKYKPDYTHAFYNRGLAENDIFELTSDTIYEKSALNDFSKALTYDLNFAPAFQSRAGIYDLYSERFTNINKDSCAYYFSLALNDFNHALDLNPNLYDIYVNRGVAYGKYGDFNHSIEDFNTYLAKFPDNASAYSNRGLAYNGLKLYDSALVDYNRAIELDSLNEGAHFNRAITFKTLSDNDSKRKMEFLEAATKDISKCIEINPKNGYFNYMRGIYKINANNREGACEDFHAAKENLIDQFCNK